MAERDRPDTSDARLAWLDDLAGEIELRADTMPLLRERSAPRVTAVTAGPGSGDPFRVRFVLEGDSGASAYEYLFTGVEELVEELADGRQTTEEAAVIVLANLAEELQASGRGLRRALHTGVVRRVGDS